MHSRAPQTRVDQNTPSPAQLTRRAVAHADPVAHAGEVLLIQTAGLLAVPAVQGAGAKEKASVCAGVLWRNRRERFPSVVLPYLLALLPREHEPVGQEQAEDWRPQDKHCTSGHRNTLMSVCLLHVLSGTGGAQSWQALAQHG